MWWSRIVTEFPTVIVISVLALNWSLILVSLVNHPFPSFEDPLLGFEVRGTEISERTNAWKLILEKTASNGILSLQPKTNKLPDIESKNLTSIEDEFKHLKEEIDSKVFSSRNHNLTKDQFFCGKILEDYAQIILSSVDQRDLFSVESIKTLCQIDRQLLRFKSIPGDNSFYRNCETKNSGKCCKSWSLHNYVLVLAQKKSCHQINENDVNSAKHLLERCAPFYHNLQLNEDCLNEPTLCRKAPVECFKAENAVFHIMHYLVDYHFLNPKTPNQSQVKYTNIFLPIAKSTQLLEYFEHLSAQSLEMEGIEVVAMDLGLKQILFDRYLLYDTIYLIIAFFVIFLSLYLYTTSLIVTIVTVMTIITSLGMAYFFYTQIFRMKFFPFMNLLSIVIAIGIGSDNALIFCKIWKSAKSDASDNISAVKLVATTLSHAWISIMAASATTGLALFAGFFSDITSIKCFSVFASTSVAVNFIITLLTLPSAVIISEKFAFCDSFSVIFGRFHLLLSSLSKTLFEEILFKTILKFRYLIVVLMGLASILSIITVVYKPKLQLPDSDEFQLFGAKHYFERYDLEFKNQFWFKRIRDKNDDLLYYLPIRVVFGVRAEDNGDQLNPLSRGSLQLEPSFDMSSEKSQLWLIQFCKELRSQSFYRSTIGPLLSNCFIETFKDWMENRKCIDAINGFDRTPCCQTSAFPYKPSVFNVCLNKVIDLLDKTPNYYLAQDWAGPRFDKKSLQMVSAVIEYDSNYSFSHSFVEMNKFWKKVNEMVSNSIKGAPEGLNKGWFISSHIEFYDLQLSLSEGTIKSIAFAVFFSFCALIVTTCDLKSSILSIITISSIIFSTIAILVALNWKLNVLESISISLTIGLAVDFTLHYTIAFKLSAQVENRINGIHYTLCRTGTPIAMAALTTCMAGLLMLFSSVLAYVQIGTFMIVLSSMSWLYSTLFHLSLLSIFESRVRQTQSRSIYSTVYSFLTRKHSSERLEPIRRITLESITSGHKFNGSVTNGGFSVSSTSSPTNSSFPNQNECHELEKMIKT